MELVATELDIFVAHHSSSKNGCSKKMEIFLFKVHAISFLFFFLCFNLIYCE